MTTKITDKNISNIANLFVSWQSVITADGSTTTTGVAGRGYFINTTSAAHTFTLPTIATAGDTISIKDYAGTFASNKLTINRNGHKIQGVDNNSLIGTNRASVTLVYIDATRGWEFVKESNVADLQLNQFISATGGTITTSGNFKIHTFTGDGCFVASQVGLGAGPSNVDYLVVAGGGGSNGSGTGGGGAGGYRTTFPSPGCNAGSFPISATTYPITVGGGGAAAVSAAPGSSGSNSIFSTITSTGGGGAGFRNTGLTGGSGGGGGSLAGNFYNGGTGNTPPVSPPQGNNGGNAGGAPFVTGGGGGAGAVGTNGAPGQSGPGGAGSTNSISTSPVIYAGGGGGGGVAAPAGTPANGGSGGPGGGGTGGTSSGQAGTAGSTNTGGGAGGGVAASVDGDGAAGGKGIVIIRYKFQ